MFTASAQYVYALLLARRGLLLALAVILALAMVGLGAALELMTASARPDPGTPVQTCRWYYGPGGNRRLICWTIPG